MANKEKDEGKIVMSPEKYREVRMETDFSVEFSVEDLPENDELVRWTVKKDEVEYNEAVEISDAPPRIFNKYVEPFPIASDAIKYRKGDELFHGDKWSEIPNGRGIDMYSWIAPNPLRRQYKYYITAYIKTKPASGGGDKRSTGDQNKDYSYTINKTFVQTVYGTWTEWQLILKRKIKERGRWRD